jgi:hypothetical protein
LRPGHVWTYGRSSSVRNGVEYPDEVFGVLVLAVVDAYYLLYGIKTTVPLHLRLLDDEAFLSGEYDTGYLERLLDEES